jgi:hypothetical protein
VVQTQKSSLSEVELLQQQTKLFFYFGSKSMLKLLFRSSNRMDKDKEKIILQEIIPSKNENQILAKISKKRNG